MANVFEISDFTFQNAVLRSKIPVLILFSAPWHGKCKQIRSIIETLASKYEGKVQFAEVNIDDNEIAFSKYNIVEIPAIFFIKNESKITEIVGNTSLAAIETAIAKIL